MKDPAETLRHWGQTFDWLGGRLSPLSQCLSGPSLILQSNPAPFVPIVSMSQRALPSSSKATPRRLSPLSQCLSGPSPHPPKATPHRLSPLSQCLSGPSPHPPQPHAVCPHCLNVSAGPPVMLQSNPTPFVPIVSMSQRALPSSSKSNPTPFVPIVSMSQRALPSSSKSNPRRLSPLSQCLSGPSPHPPKATHAVCPHCLNVFRALRLQPSKASTSPGAEKHLITSYFRFNFLRPWFQLSNPDVFVYELKSV